MSTFVRPEGQVGSALALVGEQPGRKEIQVGRPFIGPAGRELDSCLNSAKVPRRDCYITNVIKDLDHPLDYYIDISRKGVSVSPDGQKYIEMLKKELTTIGCKAVLALGNIALFALTDRIGITKWRGSIIESTLIKGLKIIPTVHPATIIPPKNVYTNKYLIVYDLIKAVKVAANDFEITPRECLIEPSFEEALGWMKYMYEEGLRGKIIELDIEIIDRHMTCFALGCEEHIAMCIPLTFNREDYFNPEHETDIIEWLGKIVSHPEIALGGQNLTFDLDFLMTEYGIIPNGFLHDTMIAQKIIMPDFPAGLDFITSVHSDIPYYKGEGKRWMKVGGSYKQFWNYNAMDAIATAACRESLLTNLSRQGNVNTYIRKCKAVYPYLYMMQEGIRVDHDGLAKERERLKEEIKQTEDRLNSLSDTPFNWASPKQIMAYFRSRGIPPYKKRTADGWRESTDEEAMIRHKRNGVKEADLILQLRRASKRLSTYMSESKFRKDGRISTFYKVHGTDTGRPSSGENIFDEGVNLQNWPHELLTFLLPDEGYWYLSFDLSQAENRIVAYVGRVLKMMEAFESGVDVHRLTAALIFKKNPDEVNAKIPCPLGDGTHSERDWGKKANHSLNYDLGYRSFGLRFELPEKEAKWICDQYHEVAYPEVRQNYHRLIQEKLAVDRTIPNLMGRKRRFMEEWGDKLFKTAYAHIPQSSVADKIDEHGLNYIYYNQNLFSPLKLAIVIHDSIGFQLPLSLEWEKQAEILRAIKQNLETPFKWNDREFVVPADLSLGLNFNKEKGIEIKSKDFPLTNLQLALKLKESYLQLISHQ